MCSECRYNPTIGYYDDDFFVAIIYVFVTKKKRKYLLTEHLYGLYSINQRC